MSRMEPVQFGGEARELLTRVVGVGEAAAVMPRHPDDSQAQLPDAVTREQIEARQAEMRRELLTARIPEEFTRTYPLPPAAAAWARQVRDIWDNGGSFGPSLLILGPTGTGKTQTAWDAIKYLGAAGPQAVTRAVAAEIHDAPEVFEKLRNFDRDDARRALMTKLCEAPLTFLDDVAIRVLKEWDAEQLYRIVNYRYQHKLPMILTSNLPPRRTDPVTGSPSFREAVGDRIASRLVAMCGQPVYLTGKDRRYPDE